MKRSRFITLLGEAAILDTIGCCCLVPSSVQAIDCLIAPDPLRTRSMVARNCAPWQANSIGAEVADLADAKSERGMLCAKLLGRARFRLR
jgi:hypothetical protein